MRIPTETAGAEVMGPCGLPAFGFIWAKISEAYDVIEMIRKNGGNPNVSRIHVAKIRRLESRNHQFKTRIGGGHMMNSDVVLYDRAGKASGARSSHAHLVDLVAKNVGGIANHYARRKIHYAGGIPDIIELNGKRIRAIHEIEVPWGYLSNLELRNLRLARKVRKVDRWLWVALPPKTKRAFNHLVLIG